MANRESASECLATQKILLESQLRRLAKVIISCTVSTEARVKDEISATVSPTIQPVVVLGDVENCFSIVRNLHRELLDFKMASDNVDNQLRKFMLNQHTNNVNLENNIMELNSQLKVAEARANVALAREKKAIAEVTKCAKDLIERDEKAEAARKITWETSVRWANRAQALEDKIKKFAPAIKAAVFSDDMGAKTFATALNKAFGIVSQIELDQLAETFKMEKEDVISAQLREDFIKKRRIQAADKLKKGSSPAKKAADKKGTKEKKAGDRPKSGKKASKSPDKKSAKASSKSPAPAKKKK